MLSWQIAIIVINAALVIGALILFRFGMSAMIGVNAKSELDKEDNYAFGIVIAGGILALMLIMSGAISGDAQASLQNEVFSVLIFMVMGIVLLKLGFLFQDKIVIRGISLVDEVKKGNVSAAIVTAVNLIAIGVIIRGAIYWSEDSTLNGIIPVIIVYVVSQIVLTAVTKLRSIVYSKRNNGEAWHHAIQKDNKAIALRFAGQLFATALVITSVSNVVTYSSFLLLEVAVTWLLISIGLMLILWLIFKAITPIILYKINVVEEVDQQENIGVALIEVSAFIGIAVVIMSFLL